MSQKKVTTHVKKHSTVGKRAKRNARYYSQDYWVYEGKKVTETGSMSRLLYFGSKPCPVTLAQIIFPDRKPDPENKAKLIDDYWTPGMYVIVIIFRPF